MAAAHIHDPSVEVSELNQTVGFRVPARLIYEALTNPQIVSAYTQAPAVIDAKVGGKFSLFGGSLTGAYTKLSPNELQYTWRFKEVRVEARQLGVQRTDLLHLVDSQFSLSLLLSFFGSGKKVMKVW
jgi:uncharacterized protein YndB with AHSA1/START domain